jgi:hypothetical protein
MIDEFYGLAGGDSDRKTIIAPVSIVDGTASVFSFKSYIESLGDDINYLRVSDFIRIMIRANERARLLKEAHDLQP